MACADQRHSRHGASDILLLGSERALTSSPDWLETEMDPPALNGPPAPLTVSPQRRRVLTLGR